MSNTLKLGNGKWATGKDTVLGYNSENNNIKPLPFSFSRNSSATVVNKDGLIETVGSGEPRIDFKDNTKGALKLEPTRSNLIPYSQDFSNAAWGYQNVTVNSNQIIAPDGTLTADKITDNSTNGAHRITDGNTTSSSGSFTYSIFLKKGTLTTAQIQVFNAATASSANVDLVNGTITSDGQGVNHTIQNYGNDWFKCSISGTLSNTTTTVYLYLKQKPSYIGNGDYLYAWGAQLEEGSYATSYIPTSGQSGGVTRVAEVCNNGGNDQVINSTEGVLYAEISPLANDLTNRHIGISDDTNTNRLQIFFNSYPTTQIRTLNLVNNVKYFDMQTNVTLVNGYAKVAIKYKENDFALWVNGIKAATDNSGLVWSNGTLDTLKFADGNNASPFYGNVKDVKLYNTALTDQELAALTS